MGKKVNPRILRVNITTSHLSKWFASKHSFADLLHQDILIRKFLKTKLRDSGVSRIEIRRSREHITIVIRTSKPGVIIGRGGAGIEELKQQLKRRFFGSQKINVTIEIEEAGNPDLDAELVVQNIIYQLEKRVPFRRAMKRAIEQVMQAGARGVKVICAGRLNGVEIARTESLSLGSIPAHTLRADIDYSRSFAKTIYGTIGVKTWIYKGDVFVDTQRQEPVRQKMPVVEKTKEKPVKRPVARSKRTIVKKQPQPVHHSKAVAA